MNVIPVETIMEIFEHLDRSSLWAMTLVAARFRAVATNNLYRELFLINSRVSRLLVSIKVNPFNATMIKCVRIWLQSTCTPPETYKELSVLLTHTTNLERLYVSPVGYVDEVEWYPPPLPKLQILEFKKIRMSAQLAESLVALPELKCLKMGRVCSLRPVAADLSPTSEHLTTIMNNLVEFEGSITLTMYLRDYGKLKYLSTVLCDCMEEWRLLHQVAAGTLQFLRLRDVDIDDCHQLLSHASRFSALRFLGVVPLNITEPPSTMGNSDYEHEIEDRKRSNEDTLKMLSSIPTLQHLSMTSGTFGDLFTPLWSPILHQLYKMADHELRYLRSLDVYAISNLTDDRFLYKKVEDTPNEFAPCCSDSGRWMEMKVDIWGVGWFED